MVAKVALLSALLLSACVDSPEPTAREVIAAECGPAPLAPGWAFAFDGDVAQTTRADAIAIAAWRADVAAYALCVEVGQ